MLVLARKYRPKCFNELIGQPTIVQTLTNAVENNMMHHAYLLCGPMGSGKTTCARILAASENCLVSPGVHPCGNCTVCKSVFEGKHIDVLEIDAASNAGKVDQIRKLKSMAQHSCIDGAKTKYYIIDEFHAASQDAGEALLKLLEEPPPGLRFILCTTEPSKIKPTIVSRCQFHDFKKIYWRILADHLENIAKLEKLNCEKEALCICAKLAQGSVRVALQNLDKLIAFVGEEKQITAQHAQSVFSIASELVFYDLMDQTIGNGGQPDATSAYKIIQKLVMSGAGFSTIADSIADCLRNLLVGITSTTAADLIYASDECKSRLKDQIKKCKGKIPSVLESIAKLSDARVAVEYGLSSELALQTWVVNSIFIFQKT